MFLKLTTICDVSHVISFTRPSSPLFFPTREDDGLGRRLGSNMQALAMNMTPFSCASVWMCN